MDVVGTVAQIKAQLAEISAREQANQAEQLKIGQRIKELDAELQQQYQRQSALDEEAIKLYSYAEQLRFKLSKLERIALLSQEFLELHQECQDNQDLLNTLYSSFSNLSLSQADKQELQNSVNRSTSDRVENRHPDREFKLSIEAIKEALPNAEKIYQTLVARYLEQYQVYQNFIIDGLDLIWCAVGFIAFGRTSYRKMSFKYHPDLDGSERAMQLINTAWEISQEYLNNPVNEKQL
jgi:chromosome segregation ATPase